MVGLSSFLSQEQSGLRYLVGSLHFCLPFYMSVYHNQDNSMLTALHLIFVRLLEAWTGTQVLLA